MRAGLAAAAAIWLTAASPRADAAPLTQVHYVMGTYFRITAEGDGAADALRACFGAARRVDAVFSRWSPTSELSRLHAAGPGTRAVGDDMARLLARALVLRQATAGAFDVAIGPVTELWRQPGPRPLADVAAAHAAAGPDAVLLRDGRVTLAVGARLDFDGIAKGWAVDACVGHLRAAGVTRALVSLGESSLAAVGEPAGASHWRLAVRGTDPATVVGWLGLRDVTASVSATRGSDGRAPHIVDPRTGRPITEEAVAVVAARSATDAEAWTKAVLVSERDGVMRARRADGVVAALRVGREAVRAEVDGDAVTWEPLPAPRRLAAWEEPLR